MNKISYNKILKCALAVVFIFMVSFGITKAEFSLTDIKTNIIVSPQNPASNQNISLTLDSPADLNRAEITWSLDNKIVLKGVGEKVLRFKTGFVGNNNKIGVVIKTQDGNIIYKDIEIRPSDIDMLWEAYTYTPPFYKGKALDSVNSIIKIVAIPHLINSDGFRISSQNLIYEWKIKDEVYEDLSGLGKNTYVFQTDIIPSKETIEVSVSSVDSLSSASGQITLISSEPKIVVYENNPLLGILFNTTFKNTFLYNNEIMLSAYPFFFSTRNSAGVDYSWRVNEKVVNSKDDSMVFIKPAESGSSKISIEINGVQSPFQKSELGFYLSF
ncbi:MAG: hypothetical protein WC849_02135 [Candidatus Paceibacterota bacterium]